MNLPLVILVAWFALGVLLAIGALWYMKTHEKQLMDEIPVAQIFGCIPSPFTWAVILFMLLFGPVVLVWAVCEGIRELRKEKDENDNPGRPPVAAAAPVVVPQWVSVVLIALIGAALVAYDWSSACPAKPLATFLEDRVRPMGYLLIIFALAGMLGRGRPFQGMRAALFLVPLNLVNLIPPVVAMLVGWEGGWLLGIAGAAAGGAAGAAAGWLLIRWTFPEPEHRQHERRWALPIAFAVLFAFFGSYNWAVAWMKLDDAWGIGVAWIFLALPGALVKRPFLGLLVAFPLILVMLVPLVASLTVGWEGGWIFGIAGATVGAAAGAVKGWLFNRWIMPEYDKRRERARAARPPGSTDGPGSSGAVAERS